MARRKVRVGIVGVGNCASSFVQGLAHYAEAASNEPPPGLMHVELGGYHVGDVEVASAFDIHAAKVGRYVGEAIFAGIIDVPEASWGGAVDMEELDLLGLGENSSGTGTVVGVAAGADRARANAAAGVRRRRVLDDQLGAAGRGSERDESRVARGERRAARSSRNRSTSGSDRGTTLSRIRRPGAGSSARPSRCSRHSSRRGCYPIAGRRPSSWRETRRPSGSSSRARARLCAPTTPAGGSSASWRGALSMPAVRRPPRRKRSSGSTTRGAGRAPASPCGAR